MCLDALGLLWFIYSSFSSYHYEHQASLGCILIDAHIVGSSTDIESGHDHALLLPDPGMQ